MTTMHVSLTLSACWFWLSVFSVGAAHQWQGIVAVLLTGKLFCLLGALLTFSPRAFYQVNTLSTSYTLADQQMAGSMMLIACPMSYVAIGTVMAARWFSKLEHKACGYG